MNKYVIKAANYINNKQHDKSMKEFIDYLNFDKVDNKLLNKNKKVVIVIPKMMKFMGGLTSVLRITKALDKSGFTVFLTAYNSNDLNTMTECAKFNLSDFKGEFITFEDALKQEFEFVIATNWQSVYFAKRLKGYKIIFAQDYEPYFYPVGDEWLLASKSYQFGFDVISLGDWNIDNIKHNLGNRFTNYANMYSIEFPFEKSEYPSIDRDFSIYKSLKNIKIAVYTKRESKRMASYLFAFFEKANNYAKTKGISLEVHYFGLNKKENVDFGINHGRLTKKEMFELYKESNFGFVASLTNVSLIPYEMLSTGLPIFEVEDGSYSYFLGNESATLIDLDSHNFVDKIIYLINNSEIVEKQIIKANEIMNKLSWDKTGKQFADILKHIEEIHND